MIAYIAGDWVDGPLKHPKLLDDYPHPLIQACEDVTGEDTPPDSPGIWRVMADDAVIETIANDKNYEVLYAETIAA
jgi:hypothetical protein